MRKYIPVQELFDEWHKDPEYQAILEATQDDWNLAVAMYFARINAGMTQEQVAKAMGTTVSVITRLETGRGNPSFRTLRRYAAATNTKVHVSFEPIGSDGESGQSANS
jgi:transcriptional regulator with XRE-family HTH domain